MKIDKTQKRYSGYVSVFHLHHGGRAGLYTYVMVALEHQRRSELVWKKWSDEDYAEVFDLHELQKCCKDDIVISRILESHQCMFARELCWLSPPQSSGPVSSYP